MWLKRILGLLLAVVICAGLWWLRPATADPVALAVVDGTATADAPAVDQSADPQPGETTVTAAPPQLSIDETRSYLEIAPQDTDIKGGLVFFQGALVDPRAYAKILSPIAEAGYLVSIIKSPFDLPIVDIGGVNSVVERHPQVPKWAVGGHSLGGVAAAAFAAGNPRITPALLLWASYPASSLASVDELTVLCVSGTADALTTVAEVEASRSMLPPSATFVAIEGAVHAYFGDYGEQRGDGTPTISREDAQAQIVTATLQWLNTALAVA